MIERLGFVGSVMISCAVGACRPPAVAPATLVDAVRADPIAASVEWQGDLVILTGTVIAKHMVPRERIDVTMGAFAPTATAIRSQEMLPLLMLEPEGRVQAFFEPRSAKEAAWVPVGASVKLSCRVHSMQGPPDGPLVTLSGCELDR